MCACLAPSSNHLAPQQGSFIPELDGYYLPYVAEMEPVSECNSSSDAEDIYAQLVQKEHDLILAAELGKALLEKNQELSKRNESIGEEYNQKLEELIQEKHELRLRLEGLEQEYDVTVRELHHDVAALRHELRQAQEAAKASERGKSVVIQELTQQNERLTDQLKKASYCEEELQTQVAGMRNQVFARRSSMHAHVQQLGLLREEINLLTERRAELERRLAGVTDERDAGRATLEEAQDRVLMLEKQKQEHEQKIRNQQREISELQDQSRHLQDKVESLSLHTSTTLLEHSSSSLYNELEMSSHAMETSPSMPHSMSTDSLDNSITAELETSFPKSLAGAARPTHLLLPPGAFPTPPLDADSDIECDDDDVVVTATLSPQSLHDMHYLAGFQSVDAHSCSIQLKQEIVSAYQEVQEMTRELRLHVKPLSGTPPAPLPGPEENAHTGQNTQNLVSLLQQLRQLMQVIVKNQILQTPPTTPGDAACAVYGDLEEKVRRLQEELEAARDQLARMRTDLDARDRELRHKSGELQSLTNKVKLSLQHQELQAVQAERDRLQDHAAGLTRDTIVQQARDERNHAIQKRNSMEVELAQAKLDLMSLDSQLMEAIQQKVALSQQLEQWQEEKR